MKVRDGGTKEIFASLLIIGAGPAGLAAALAAAHHAKSVVIIDENAEAGGQIWRHDSQQVHSPAAQLKAKLLTYPHVQFVFGARVIAMVEQCCLLIETSEGAQQLRWEKLILCNGARELLLPFPGWTLPGVTGAGGLQAMIKSGADVKGKRVVIAGTGPLLLSVAASVKKAQGHIVAIVEQRSAKELLGFSRQLFSAHRSKFWQALGLISIINPLRYRHSAVVTAAHGDRQLHAVTLVQAGKQEEISCDLLACGFGLRANVELAELLQCQVQDGLVVVDAQQRTSRENIWAAGEITGIGGVEKALIEGRIAGLSATNDVVTAVDALHREDAYSFATLLNQTFSVDTSLRKLCKPDTLVCRCEDVAAQDLAPFTDWRTAKLMTRAGMGACQGRICGAACQFLYEWDTPEARQPVFPAKAASLALLAEKKFSFEK
ncbi:NAD(P)/FAD-dependent oxidoreductase [Undibacterium jejuense]|uniref:NAD(P)/FAD-dependent oxidoreductase n=1 Tax=Undibacterium jejuense TaxID=1344949 RepID=UPI001C9A758D|nr:FAD/NAD(P)-binding oxidoreductase [Undibacterium jejuense]